MSDVEPREEELLFELATHGLIQVGDVNGVMALVFSKEPRRGDAAALAVAAVPHLLAGSNDVATFQRLGPDDADDAAAPLEGAPFRRRHPGNQLHPRTNDCSGIFHGFRHSMGNPVTGTL